MVAIPSGVFSVQRLDLFHFVEFWGVHIIVTLVIEERKGIGPISIMLNPVLGIISFFSITKLFTFRVSREMFHQYETLSI